MLAALARNDGSLQTGRGLVTTKGGALDAGMAATKAQSLRIADARDFSGQAIAPDATGDGARIDVGKVLSNAGSGSTASVLAGMNWRLPTSAR